MECRDIQISCIAAKRLVEPLGHADLKKISRQKRPSTQRYLAATRRAPHREAFIPNVKILGVQSRLVGLMRAHRPREVAHMGRPTRLAGP
jgi:hypothetical protein